MSPPDPAREVRLTPDDELFSVVDREAADEAERRDSKLLYHALKQRRDELGAAGQIPAEDRQLSEKILGDARQRSAQINASPGHAIPSMNSKPIPWWLIIAWLVAIAALIAGYLWLR